MPRWSRILLALTLLVPATARADILHLKDGRELKVDSWSYQGDQVIFEIAGGTMTIPRSLVERVEATAPPAPPRPPAAEAPAPARGATVSSPGAPPRPASPRKAPAEALPPSPAPRVLDVSKLSDEELARAVESLKRGLRDHPRQHEEISRQIAVGLSALGSRAAQADEGTMAESRFGEALGYDPSCLQALVGLSATYLKEGKLPYARSQIQEGLAAHPRDPMLHFLLGEVDYRQENVADALSEWETSLSLKPDPQVAARLEKARREFAVDQHYNRDETAHFTLRHQGEGAAPAALVSEIRDYLEEKFPDLSARFQYAPTAPFVVLLYPTREFHEATRTSASVAGLFDGKIRVPIGGLRQLTPESRAVLVHELTHAFVFGKSRGTCPRWLQEGLAQLMEGRTLLPSEERILARDLAASEGRAILDDDVSYPAALSFTRYLAGRFPFDLLVDALDRMGRGSSAEAALQEATRESFADLQKGWTDEVVRQFVEKR
jgi:tetratricopeptide (TPR) repeat protein